MEGEVRITYHGHAAVGERVDHAGESYVERRKALERKIRSVVGPALLSDTRIDCPDDATKPCTYRFRMKVPGFAAVSGKRLVISPSVFQAGRPPVFPRPERKSPIVFPYAWSEYDTTVIVLPSRFGWEASEPPVRLSLGEGGRFSWDLVANARGDTLTLFRSWKTYSIVVQPSEYASLWQSYRRLHEVDNRVVTLPRRPPR